MNKFLLIFLLLLVSLAAAHEGIRTPEGVISTIMSQQGVNDTEKIGCSHVSEANFEELGDAVMERMASHELHEQMDAMMGGEGSASLEHMHIAMGKNWLGCTQAMSANMMPMMMRMMGNYYPAYYNSPDMLLVFGIAGWVLFIASVIFFYSRMPKIRKR